MSSPPDGSDYLAWRDRLADANDPRFWPIGAIDKMLSEGRAQFWCDGSAALVTQVVEYPGGAIALEAIAGAGDLLALTHAIEPSAREWACNAGLSHLKIAGRFGWMRKMPPGWKAHQVVMLKEL